MFYLCRYSCKIALDQTLLGKIDSDSEFADYLQDYEENWHIGLDTDRCWQEAISKHVPNLFSLGYNPSAVSIKKQY